MALFPINGEFTVETYLDGLRDDTIGMGAWSKEEGNQYNFSIEFDRFTTEHQILIIQAIREDPELQKKFEGLADAYLAHADYYDSGGRDMSAMLSWVLEGGASAASEPDPIVVAAKPIALPTPDGAMRFAFWQGGRASAVEICDDTEALASDPLYPLLDDVCGDALDSYAKLPLNRSSASFTDLEQLDPVTADVCGRSAFKDLVAGGYAAGTGESPESRAARESVVQSDYGRCEDILYQRSENNAVREDIAFTIVNLMPASLVARYKIAPTDIPKNSLDAAVESGFDSNDITEVGIVSAKDGEILAWARLENLELPNSLEIAFGFAPKGGEGEREEAKLKTQIFERAQNKPISMWDPIKQ